jgi:hypothetical protein
VVYGTKVLISGYPSIDMHCIVMHVNSSGKLSMSVLRMSNFLQKFGGSKTDQFLKSSNFEIFQVPPFGKRQTLELQ